MKSDSKHIELFNESGCITLEVIGLYQEKRLSGKDREKVEKHLQECELCRDAVEGYALLGEPSRHRQAVASIRERYFTQRYGKRRRLTPTYEKNWKVRNWPFYASIAAASLALIVYFTLVSPDKSATQDMIAEQVETRAEERTGPEEEPAALQGSETVETEDIEIGGVRSAVEEPQPVTEITKPAEQPLEEATIVADDESVALEEDVLAAVPGYDSSILVKETASEGAKSVVAAKPAESVVETSREMAMEPETRKKVASQLTSVDEIAKPDPDPVIHTEVDQMPQFRNKKFKTFEQYVEANKVYPRKAKIEGIEGTVTVRFVVDEKGKVGPAEVIESTHPILEEPSLEVVGKSPDWIPGKKEGIPVRVYMTVAVKYLLDGSN